MLTAAHVVLLGKDADAQACVAAALPPVALGRLRRTCHGARGAAPVGVDWARLCQPSELAAAGELRALRYLYVHDNDNLDPFDTLLIAAHQGRCKVVVWVLDHWQWDHDALFQVAKSTFDREVLRRLAVAGLEHSPNTLLSAALNGNMALLTAALDAGVPPDSGVSLESLPGYGDKLYALATACEFGHPSCARALLERGVDVDRQGSSGPALVAAARRGNIQCARLLLAHRADVHARTKVGSIALMEATHAGQTECVRLLIRHHTDVHARDNDGRTALNYGPIGNGDTNACTRELLAAGADVNTANQYSRNALMYAAMWGKQSLSPLLEAGADVHTADTDGFTPMLYACRFGCMQNVMLLYQRGADPHEVSADGTTALMLACEGGYFGGHFGGYVDIVRWLIDNNVDLDAVQHGDEGQTALTFSSGDKRRMLIEARADLEATDTQGYTTLIHDCQNGYTDKARELIASGADTDSFEGRRAMDLAKDIWECDLRDCGNAVA